MSIKGVDKGLFILPGNRQTWPCIRSQSTDFGKQLLTGIPATRGVSLTKNNNWKEDNQKRRDMKDLAFLVSHIMAFFKSAVGSLQTIVIALGAGLGVWGAINLLEGYGNDNPGAKSQGMKQLMAGGGVALVGTTLVPLLAGLF